MDQRPKRNIKKPRRYKQTTSSDENQKRRKMTARPITDREIDDDVDYIRNTLQEDTGEEDSDESIHLINNDTHTYLSPYTRDETQTNIELHTNVQSYDTNFQPHANITPTSTQSHANLQSHTNIQPHTTSQSLTNFLPHTNIEHHTSTQSHANFQSHTNIQPHTSSQSLANILPPTNIEPPTSTQSHANLQSHTNIQPHTSSQSLLNILPHTNIEPHKSTQSHANLQSHTNIQPHTSTQSHANFQSHTNIQPHTSNQSYANIQSHRDIQSYANVQSYTPYNNTVTNTAQVTQERATCRNTISEFQNTRSVGEENFYPSQQPGLIHPGNWRSGISTDNRSVHERLNGIELQMKKTNTLLENILKIIQDRQRPTRKPTILPVSSLAELDTFENIDDNDYFEIVHYFRYVGGFNLKEAVNLCFKEGLTDAVTPSFTWWGREGGQRSLYNTRLVMAIYEAVCNNRHFDRPTRSEFQSCMREALRTAKERHRNKTRGPRDRRGVTVAGASIRRDLWSDERRAEDDTTNTIESTNG